MGQPITGELVGVTSATALPNTTCVYVNFKARAANTGKVYIGVGSVAKAAGTTNANVGWELAAGQETGWLNLGNLSQMSYICDATTDSLIYFIMR